MLFISTSHTHTHVHTQTQTFIHILSHVAPVQFLCFHLFLLFRSHLSRPHYATRCCAISEFSPRNRFCWIREFIASLLVHIRRLCFQTYYNHSILNIVSFIRFVQSLSPLPIRGLLTIDIRYIRHDDRSLQPQDPSPARGESAKSVLLAIGPIHSVNKGIVVNDNNNIL